MSRIRIKALSDLHGNFPDLRGDPVDLVLIAGDILPQFAEHSIEISISWYTGEFYRWCKRMVSCDKIFFIFGSHDYAMENFYPMVAEFFKDINGKVQLLHNEIKTYRKDGRELNVYGTPFNRNNRRYSFSRTDRELRRIYSKFDDDIDIVLSHEAPYGFSDIDPLDEGQNIHMGSTSLKRFVQNTEPRVLVHGKYHSATHEKERLGMTDVYNVSLLDDNNELIYKPLIFEL